MAEQTTIQLHDRDAFWRDIKRLEIEYDAVYDAEAADLHTAIVQVALDNPDLLLHKLERS